MSGSSSALARRLAEAILVLGAYLLLAQTSYLFVFPPGINAIFWLPSGLTFALFLRTNRRRWPVWLFVVFVTELAVVLGHGEPVSVALGWSVANCLFPLTSAWLLCRVAGAPFSLSDVRAVVLLVLAIAIGAIPGALVAAAAASAWLDAPFVATRMSWWASDALGAMLVAPLVLTALEPEPRPPGGAIEALASGAVLVGIGVTVFGAEAPGHLVVALPYLLVPVVAWVAVRFGKRGAATATVVLDFLAVWHTARGRGPFAAISDPPASLLDVQLYVAVLGVFALMLATAEMHERRVRASAQAAERQSSFLAEATAVLSESFDYAERMNRLARLCVRSLADWCFIDVVEGGQIRRIGGAHADPRKAALVGELQRRYAPNWDSPQPTARVVREREPLLVPEVTDALCARYTVDEEHRQLVLDLGIATAMAVPLVVRDVAIGALWLARADRSRAYGPADLALAQELGRRAAVAIDNARLYRDAREAVRLRDEFLSIASHELNTPITSLLLALDVIERGAPASPETRRMLMLANRQARRLARLVDELLAVSRIVAGRLPLQPEQLDLAELVRDVAGGMQQDLSRAACPLSVAAEAPVAGRWDRLRLEQLVTNLLSNALKFGAGKPIEIDVARADGSATLIVRDHGIGIPADRAKAIFERFERAVSTHAYGGLGLGLYIARSIVEAHGGAIRADTAPGGGARFIVELPCAGPAQLRAA